MTAVNDPPVAAADGPYLVKQGTSLSVDWSIGVTANDTDIDGASLPDHRPLSTRTSRTGPSP